MPDAPNNFEWPDMHWFRKMDHHPNAAEEHLSRDFSSQISDSLGIPRVRIFWFEEANPSVAKPEWKASPCWGRPSTDDPLRQEQCSYFRWNGPRECVFHGYTHFESPVGIMINARCGGQSLLEAIAEECFHIHQDLAHGAGWRSANERVAEEEAKAYLLSIEDTINRFLPQ